MEGLIYPELSYELVGLAFDVYNDLGFGYQEKYYTRAYELLLTRRKKLFKKEQKCVILFQGRRIGRYFIDFVIENKVVIEFKVGNNFYHQHFKQVIGYLKATDLKLGIIILFTPNGIKTKRIVN